MKSQSSPSTANTNAGNPLGIAPTGRLLAKFAIPAIISMLVNALYNIVDQIFIGQGVGMLGNAATNIAFPVTTISTAAALLSESAVHLTTILKWELEENEKQARLQEVHYRHLLL